MRPPNAGDSKMKKMLALDIETGNFSHEIGGWGQSHMFEPTVVATWDGDKGIVYANEGVSKYLPENTEVKPLHPKVIGEDLAKHVSEGGMVLGHNLKNFDLPIIRDALDCWTAGDIMAKSEEQVFDTSALLRSIVAHAVPLCLKDAQLVYELWEHGMNEGFVKARCRHTGDIKEFEVDW